MAVVPTSALLRHIRRLSQPAVPLTDGQLLERFIAEQDQAAFAELIGRHGALVLDVCRRTLGREQDAEDALQATFLVLARKAASIHKTASLASWLYGVAWRCAARLRADLAKRRRHERKVMPSSSEEPPDPTWREVQEALHEELARLPEKYRAPLVLCYLEGRTQCEAAQQLGCGQNVLRGRLDRGRERLRQRLRRRGITMSAALLAAGVTSKAPVSAALIHATQEAATLIAAGQTVSSAATPTVAALVESAVGAVETKVKPVVFLIFVGIIGGWIGLATCEQPAVPGQQPMGEAKADATLSKAEGQKPKTDRYGDALPEGALVRMGTMRLRHGRGATLAFTSDGKSIISFGGDRTLHFWDPATGRLMRTQTIPNGDYVRNTVLSPDGRLLTFQDFENMETLYVWDVERKELRHQWSVGVGSQLRIAFSQDSKTLITAHENGELRAWNVATGESRLLGKQKRDALSLAFSPDGSLMTLSWEPLVRFWDLKAGGMRSKTAIPEDIVGATISPDGQTIAVWTWHNEGKDKGVRFLDAATGNPAVGWNAPSAKKIRVVQLAPDGKTAFVGTQDGLVVWDPIQGKEVHSFPNVGGVQFAFSPDGKTAAALGNGNHHDPQGALLHVWDLATGTPRAAATAEKCHLHEVESLAFAPDGRTLASACPGDGTVRRWELSTGRQLGSLSVQKEGGFRNLIFAPDGKQLFLGSSSAIVRRDSATGTEIARYPLFKEGKDERHHLLTMHLADDGRTLRAISQYLDNQQNAWGLHAWDVGTGRHLQSGPLPGVSFWVGYSAFSHDGRLLATPDGGIHDTSTGKELFRLSVDGHSLGMPVAFSPDAALLAAGVYRKLNGPKFFGQEMIAVQVWELATLLPIVRLDTGKLAQVAFTPDGQRLITAGRDALQLWDLVSGKVVARRAAPGRFWGSFGPSFASSMAVAPNGCTVATGHADTTILAWDLSPPTASVVARTLTAERLDALWADLAGDDARRALAAQARLGEVPEQATRLLRDRLRPAQAPPEDELHRLIAELDAAQFARREKATQRLGELDEMAHAALREALKREPTAEVRRRIEKLLDLPPIVRDPEGRRSLRAVRILVQLATPDARQLLQKLAAGASDARLTREAKAALERLNKQ